MNKANEWIKTDPQACRRDVERLGLGGATKYQMDLISDRSEAGDTRWNEITVDQMWAALAELEAA